MSEIDCKLKPCPFCGGEAKEYERWNKRTVERECATGELTLTQLVHWLADHEATLINLRGPRGYALYFDDEQEPIIGKDPLELIKGAINDKRVKHGH